MSIHDVRYPGESEAYRLHRNELLQAEMALRAQIEEVAELRRALPPGGIAQDYVFQSAQGPVPLSEMFGTHDTLIVYSYMYKGNADKPCPMCSAFMDSLIRQIEHVTQRAAFAVVARAPMEEITALVAERNWQALSWFSAADNTYPADYHSEMPNGAQVPMCTVFTKTEDGLRHFWSSELFFAPTDTHPRHVDMLWPLWHIFDVTPEGRANFMPAMNYSTK